MYKSLSVLKSGLLLLCLIPAAFADDFQTPEFSFIPEAPTASSVQIQLGAGLLDKNGFGESGSPLLVMTKANFALDTRTSAFIQLPLAGTLSSGPDTFGMGNISLGLHRTWIKNKQWSLGSGLDIAFPTFSSDAIIGSVTRHITSFFKNQYAVSPRMDFQWMSSRWAFTADIGLNEHILSNTTGPFGTLDRFHTSVFYDAGLTAAVVPSNDFYASLEFGGYSTFTADNNENYIYAGPGVRYQNEETSLGLHIVAPLSSPAKDGIDFMVLTDFRWRF